MALYELLSPTTCLRSSSSSSSSKGIVQELTMLADLRLALELLPELPELLELTELTVDMVEIGLMVLVRPDKELSPESELE